MAEGPEGNHEINEGRNDEDKPRKEFAFVEEFRPRRSKIPFDITNMTYDEYCAKHYSLAIEHYRQQVLYQSHNPYYQAPHYGSAPAVPMYMMNSSRGSYSNANGNFGQSNFR